MRYVRKFARRVDPRTCIRILRGFAPGRPVGGRMGVREVSGNPTMFAVVRCGGKQYRVAVDDVLSVEKLDGEAGATLKLEEILLLGGDSPKAGAPLVSGAVVHAEILEHGRGEKVVAFKKKRRKNTHRKRGHRQPYTKLKITAIHTGAQEA